MSLFVTFEGPEGSGKTTQVRLLAERLRRDGWPVLATREPGGTRIGDAVRHILMEPNHAEMDPLTETLLFNAARAQIVAERIRPALAAGQIVICDRYADSTLAYQGHGHGQNLSDLRNLIAYATGGLSPDLTIYLDLPAAAGLRRKREDQDLEWNRLDAQTLAFHERVRAGYLSLLAAEPERWIQIDARRPVESVQQEIHATLIARLAEKAEKTA